MNIIYTIIILCVCLGSEVAYGDIMKMADSSSIAILYDQQLQSPYFNIRINGTSHQVGGVWASLHVVMDNRHIC